MVLHDACFYGEDQRRHIHLPDGIIRSVTNSRDLSIGKEELHVELDGATVLPGLINSHDHLDFNCFPQLGNKIYHNYTEWGPDIQSSHAETIRQVQEIPESLRIAWGLYKNLFNGFTTVVNHGKKLPVEDELISVFQQCNSLHSPAFEKHWTWKLKNPFSRSPVVMHIGEGTDSAASNEIDKVIKANIFNKKIIAIHGVAMSRLQAPAFKGLAWCPASNYFFLGRTAAIDQLKTQTQIVFGTDSTLTSSWEINEHFQLAKQTGMVNETEFLSMLSTQPAALWKITDRGEIATGKTADILIIKRGTNIFNLRPSDILLVIHRGKIRLADELITGGRELCAVPFSRVKLGDTVKQVQGNPLEIAKEIKKYFPSLFIPFTVGHD